MWSMQNVTRSQLAMYQGPNDSKSATLSARNQMDHFQQQYQTSPRHNEADYLRQPYNTMNMHIDSNRDRDTQFNPNAPGDRFQKRNFRYSRGWHQKMQESAKVGEYGANNEQATESILKSHPSQGLTAAPVLTNSVSQRSQSMSSEVKSHPLMARTTMFRDSQSLSSKMEARGHQPRRNVNKPDANTDLSPSPNCTPPNGTIAPNRHLDELAHPLLLLSASKPKQKLAPSFETKSSDMGEHSSADLKSTPALLNLEAQPLKRSTPQLPVAKIKNLSAYPEKATTRKATEIDLAKDTDKKRPRKIVTSAIAVTHRANLTTKDAEARRRLHEQRKRLHAISERTRTREVAAKIRELRQMMLEQGVRCPENKATTLITAVEYVKNLSAISSNKKHRNKLLRLEYQRLQAQLQQLPKPFGAGVTENCGCGTTQIFDNQPLPVVLVNSRLRIQDCSNSFLSMIGIASKGWASNQLLTTLCLKEGPKSRPGTPHPLELCWDLLNGNQRLSIHGAQSCFTILLREKNEHDVMLNMVGTDLMQLTFLKHPEGSNRLYEPKDEKLSET